HVEGVDVIGPMPPEVEIVTTFSGAVCAASEQVDTARALLNFIRSPAADAAKQRSGMQPV
ncbi:MAG TPA: substrate-binding domain-containing protein, partial [Sphingomicrobium sp.]